MTLASLLSPAARLIAVFAIIIVAPACAAAQTVAASADPGVEKMVEAGDLTARIFDSGQAAPYAAGGSAFASIRITPKGEASKDRRERRKPGNIAATLSLSAENGEILLVTGDNAKATVNGGEVAIEGMRPGQESVVLVELRLIEAETPAKLKIVLKDAGGVAAAPVEIVWAVKDCAGGYYRELRRIAEAGGDRLSKLLAEVRSPDKNLPRASLFRAPQQRAARGGRECVRYKREWNPYSFQYERVCASYRAAAPRPEASTAASREEREIFNQASAIMRAGGADPKLDRSGSLGLVTGKVADDLRIYLNQPAHPALCTGAVQFSAYHLKQLAGLRSHVEGVIAKAEKARALASAKAVEAKGLAQSAPGGHPGVGLAPFPIVKAAQDAADPQSLRAAILKLAPYAGVTQEEMTALAAAPDELAMLKIVKPALDRADEGEREVVKAVTPAFALIEAAVHLTIAEARYQKLRGVFIGSFEGIRDAHEKHCVCGG
jgi:hypothetical protein